MVILYFHFSVPWRYFRETTESEEKKNWLKAIKINVSDNLKSMIENKLNGKLQIHSCDLTLLLDFILHEFPCYLSFDGGERGLLVTFLSPQANFITNCRVEWTNVCSENGNRNSNLIKLKFNCELVWWKRRESQKFGKLNGASNFGKSLEFQFHLGCWISAKRWKLFYVIIKLVSSSNEPLRNTKARWLPTYLDHHPATWVEMVA